MNVVKADWYQLDFLTRLCVESCQVGHILTLVVCWLVYFRDIDSLLGGVILFMRIVVFKYFLLVFVEQRCTLGGGGTGIKEGSSEGNQLVWTVLSDKALSERLSDSPFFDTGPILVGLFCRY